MQRIGSLVGGNELGRGSREEGRRGELAITNSPFPIPHSPQSTINCQLSTVNYQLLAKLARKHKSIKLPRTIERLN
ncbi:MAG: hypothetical protein HC942_03925 [Microcoleus sp. SU_5_6]|nr:hypothetical protein [Microcoleus sp. SU_5_6]